MQVVVCARRQAAGGVTIVTAVDGAKHSFVETQGQLCTRVPIGGLRNGRHVVHVALSSGEPQAGKGGAANGAAAKGGAAHAAAGEVIVYEELLTRWAETAFVVSNEPATHALARYRSRGVRVTGFMHVTGDWLSDGWVVVVCGLAAR